MCVQMYLQAMILFQLLVIKTTTTTNRQQLIEHFSMSMFQFVMIGRKHAYIHLYMEYTHTHTTIHFQHLHSFKLTFTWKIDEAENENIQFFHKISYMLEIIF